MTTTYPRPPIDPELAPFLAAVPEMTRTLTPEGIPASRQGGWGPSIEETLAGSGITMTTHRVRSHDGEEIDVHVFAKDSHRDRSVPGIYHIHGGGMVGGNSTMGLDQQLRWVTEHDAVLASVEYRLAPEHPDPTPVEDAYAGLVWFSENAGVLGFDPARVLILGGSAGGGLTAGTTLLARDRRGPSIAWQLLICPMLDDRDQTISSQQIVDGVPWDRPSNRVGWTALLGDRKGTDDVSIYAAPARATDLAGLPPTFIDVGSAEVFRDEAVAYASGIWAAGGDCELHVWAGGFHGFGLVQTAQVAVDSLTAVDNWVRRQISRLPR